MLKTIEKNFINAIKNDYSENHKNSFLNVLFGTSPLDMDEIRKDINLNIEDDDGLNEILNRSDFIFYTKGGFLLGKYEDDFWIYSSEGEMWGAGKKIQNTCNIIRQLLYYTLDDKKYIESMFKENGYPSYKKIISKYKNFCNSLGLNFVESDTEWMEESKEFDLMLQEKDIM